MSNIVERLRDPEQGLTSSDRFHLHKEAADEIELLLAVIATQAEKIADINIENARLREHVRQLATTISNLETMTARDV